MARTKVLIVEDESIVAKDIQQSLEKLGYDVIGTAPTGENAITLALEKHPEVVLMDIMLKGEKTGVESADEIRAHLDIPVIYLTAYADENTLAKAKVTEPYGYIIKPFKEADLHTTIEMALYKHGKEREVRKERDLLYQVLDSKDSGDRIFVKSKHGLVKLQADDVYYIEALKDYVVINTQTTRYTVHSTMKDIEKKIPTDRFLRVHRSYIVNLDKVERIEQNHVVLQEDRKSMPIGGAYKETLQERINLI
ncbi:MAG: LytTR family transcriptional regulator DNA-binding domain-containing protein [Flavobacteriales bacterium]